MSGDEAAKPAASAKPKSRFLRTGGTSDSESSSEEESDESEEEQKTAPGGQKVSRFLATGSDDEDSDEEVKRVVKSAKDKRLEEMEATGNVMNNALKINDWTAISTGELCLACSASAQTCKRALEFDKLLRMIQRQQNVGEPIPPFFIRTIVNLETSINDAQSKDAKKKMNATNARAFTAMKQKVKKTLKDFEREVKQYQEVRLAPGVTRFLSRPRVIH